jgi:hypothetical protein
VAVSLFAILVFVSLPFHLYCSYCKPLNLSVLDEYT